MGSLRKRRKARALERAERERNLFMAIQLTYGAPFDRSYPPLTFVEAVNKFRGTTIPQAFMDYAGLWRRYYAWYQEKQRVNHTA